MELLPIERVRIRPHAATQDAAIEEVAGMLVDAGAVTDSYLDGMRRREALAPTSMGGGLAIPHGDAASADAVLHAALALVRYDGGVDWAGAPVRFVVGLAGLGDTQLELLGRIAIAFDDEGRTVGLEAAATPEELLELLDVR